MEVSPYNTLSIPFPVWRGCQNYDILHKMCSNYIVWTKRVSYMLPKAPVIILLSIHLRNISICSKQQYQLLLIQHNIPFPVLSGCPKSDICMQFEWFLYRNDMVWTMMVLLKPSEAPLIILIYLRKIIECSFINECPPL